MSFDARSLERLEALGRRLPSRLPTPRSPDPQAPASEATTGEKRHRVETETDPEALFHELMQVSPDGRVPPHLLSRLRELEGQQRSRAESARRDAPSAPDTTPTTTAGRRQTRPDRHQHQALYTEFQQLLLENEDPG